MLRFRDLTIVEKAVICNGCGAKGGWIKVPNFIFKASCNQHDFYYWRGGFEEDRKKADASFYKFMKIDIRGKDYNIFKKNWYLLWAYTYYIAVRLFGKKAFDFSSEMKTEKDLSEL